MPALPYQPAIFQIVAAQIAPRLAVPFFGKCLQCGEIGHRKVNYPQRQGCVAPLRDFAVLPSSENVQGTFDLFHSRIKVLFDTGASQSFIYKNFVDQEKL